MSQLRDDEWDALRTRYTAFLNGFDADADEPLPDDYFVHHVVHGDVVFYGMYRYLLVEMYSDDEGGPTMLFIHTYVDDFMAIEYSSYTFDTTTSVWISNSKEVSYS